MFLHKASKFVEKFSTKSTWSVKAPSGIERFLSRIDGPVYVFGRRLGDFGHDLAIGWAIRLARTHKM